MVPLLQPWSAVAEFPLLHTRPPSRSPHAPPGRSAKIMLGENRDLPEGIDPSRRRGFIILSKPYHNNTKNFLPLPPETERKPFRDKYREQGYPSACPWVARKLPFGRSRIWCRQVPLEDLWAFCEAPRRKSLQPGTLSCPRNHPGGRLHTTDMSVSDFPPLTVVFLFRIFGSLPLLLDPILRGIP